MDDIHIVKDFPGKAKRLTMETEGLNNADAPESPGSTIYAVLFRCQLKIWYINGEHSLGVIPRFFSQLQRTTSPRCRVRKRREDPPRKENNSE